MVTTFKYKQINNTCGLKHKPTIDLILQGRSKFSIKTAMLLDSGADVSVIPLDLAKLLDIDLSMKESVTNGIGGEVKSKRTSMKVSIYLKEDHRLYTYTIPVEVILDDDPPPILGRDGFFDKFQITIIEAEEKIKLKKYSKKFKH
ncbi:MAG TPA: aspartyl protease family protein [Candidatus Nanoarchaeia archaeon]|nr:aspartyl protease family protein [Candidatus Nanoarchaeia archaeon]